MLLKLLNTIKTLKKKYELLQTNTQHADSDYHKYLRPTEDSINPNQDFEQLPEPIPKKNKTSNKVTLVAVGDNLLHLPIIKAAKTADNTFNFDSSYELIRPLITGADLSIVNQETIFGGSESPFTQFPRFNTPEEIGDSLVRTGFDVILMANNHVMDMGENGLRRTLQFWKQHHPQIITTGAYSSAEEQQKLTIVERNGIKLALLNYSYDVSQVAYYGEGQSLPPGKDYLVNFLKDQDFLKDQIQEAKQNADVVIVFPHWGKEYQHIPWGSQRRLTEFFANQGVDIVIGSHPHVVQPAQWVEKPDGKNMLVYYSLGNFFSCPQKVDISKLLGGIAKLTIERVDNEIVINNVEFDAVITHYNTKKTEFKLYPLSDYTNELAKVHGILRNDSNFTLDYLHQIKRNFMTLNNLRITENYHYIELETTVAIAKYTGTEPNIVIPSHINDKPVVSIDHFAFSKNSIIQSITLPNTITHIGTHAFSGCDNLEKVILGASLEKIEAHAFFNATALKDINLGATQYLTFLGERAFGKCTSLTSLELPKSLTTIPTKLCISCSNLKNVLIPESIQIIGESAFRSCRRLKDIKLPSQLKIIESTAFMNCRTLNYLELPKTVTAIAHDAFKNTSKLEAFIHAQLQEIKKIIQ